VRLLSLEPRLALMVAALSVGVGLGVALISSYRFEREVHELGAERLKGAVGAFEELEHSEIEKMAATLDALMANPELRQAFVARDREALRRRAAPLFATLRERDGITHWYFHLPGPGSQVFLRVHEPELFDDAPTRTSLRRVVDGASLGAGLELGRTAFALRVVRPWYDGETLLGYLELAEEIDHYLSAMKGRTGDEYGLLVKKSLVDARAWSEALGPRTASWNDRPDLLVVDATSGAEGILDFAGDLETLPDAGRMLGEISLGDRVLLRGLFPIRDSDRRLVGALFVVHDFTTLHLAAKQARTVALSTAFLGALLIAAGLAVLVRLLVFRRLGRLATRLSRNLGPAARPGDARAFGGDDLGRLEGLLDRALEAPAVPREGPKQTDRAV
jgi:Double sensory domain of two-component sensor kinase